ncbi:hypothetical protein D3C87_1245660 [compost metagenome]|jgi:hypothetical protein
MTVLTVISTVVIISSGGSSAVTQTTYPVEGPSCPAVVQTVWGFGTEFRNGRSERVSTIKVNGSERTKVETLECVLRPGGV